jgi:hypothetical protein
VYLCSRLGVYLTQTPQSVLKLIPDQVSAASSDTSIEVTQADIEAKGNTSENRSSTEIIQNIERWENELSVEIFQIEYSNENNQVTVKSSNGTKVFAPGTSGSHDFLVENETNQALDYTILIEITLDENVPIPIVARISNQNGVYLMGSENNMVSIRPSKSMQDSAVIAGKHYAKYTLEWQWPFEGDDTLDTILGNRAIDEELTITVTLKTVATQDVNPQASGGIPQTGDSVTTKFSIVVSAFFLILSASVLLRLWIISIKERKRVNKSNVSKQASVRNSKNSTASSEEKVENTSKRKKGGK